MPRHVESNTLAYLDERRIALRMPGELHDRLAKLAAVDERSLNAELNYLLRLGAWVQENLLRLPPQADEPDQR